MKKPTLLSRLAGSAIALSLTLLSASTALVTPAVALTATPVPSPTPTTGPIPTATPFIPYDALQEVMTVESVSIGEGNSGTKNLNIQLKVRGFYSPNNKPVKKDDYQVKFWTQARTASPNIDYTPLSSTFNVGGTEFTKTISIPIKGDTTAEGDEVFEGNFTSGPRAVFNTPSGGASRSMVIKCTIIDDDSPAPVASGGTLTTVSGATGEATLSAKGKAGATFGYRIVTSPSYGKASIRQNGATSILSYTAPKGYVGNDSLTLQAFDNVKTGPVATWKVRVVARSSTLVSASPSKSKVHPVAFQLRGESRGRTANLSTLFLNYASSAAQSKLLNAASLGFYSDANLLHTRWDEWRGWSQWMH